MNTHDDGFAEYLADHFPGVVFGDAELTVNLQGLHNLWKTAQQRARMMTPGAALTIAESRSVCERIDQLSGGNADSIFAWDGTDNLNDPTTSGAHKLFTAAGRATPV